MSGPTTQSAGAPNEVANEPQDNANGQQQQEAAVQKVAATVVRRGDIERANNAFAKGIELLYDLKLLPRALSLITEAICVKPRNASWFMARGQVNRAMGRYHHALHDFSSVIKLEPRNGACYCLRSIALRKLRKYGPALADANTALQLEPENAFFRFYRGLILMDAEEYSSACDDFTAAAEGSDKLAFRCRLLRAFCQEKLGLFQEALVDLAAAVRLESQNSAAYDHLAAFLMRQGHYQEALHQLNQASPHLSTSTYSPALVLARRSEANFALQKYGHALADAQLAVACLPQNHGDLVGQVGLMKPISTDLPTDPELLLPNQQQVAAPRPAAVVPSTAGGAAAGAAGAPATPATPAPAPAPGSSSSSSGSGVDLSEVLSQPSTAYSLALGDLLFTRDTPYVYMRRGMAYLANQLPLAALPDLLHASLCADTLVRRSEAKDRDQQGGGQGGKDGKGGGDGEGGAKTEGAGGNRDSPGRKKPGFSVSRRTGSALGRGGASSLFGGPAIDSVDVLAPELAQAVGEPIPSSIYNGLAAVASSLTVIGGSNTGIVPPSASALGLGFLSATALSGAPGTGTATAGLTSPGAGSRTSRGTLAAGGFGGTTTRGTLATANASRAALTTAGSNSGAAATDGAGDAFGMMSDDDGHHGFSGMASAPVDDDVIAAMLAPKPLRHTPFGPAITHPGPAPELPDSLLHDDEEALSDVENEIRATFTVAADRVGRGRRRSLVVQQKGADAAAGANAGGDDDDDDDGPAGGLGSPAADDKKGDDAGGDNTRSFGMFRRGGDRGDRDGDKGAAEAAKASLAVYSMSFTPQEGETRKKAAAIARRSIRSRVFRSQQSLASGSAASAGPADGGRADTASRDGMTLTSPGGARGGTAVSAHASNILASVNARWAASGAGRLPPQVKPALTRQGRIAAAMAAPRLRSRAPLVALSRAWPPEPAPWLMPQKSRDLAILVSQIQLGLGLAYASLRHYVRARVHIQRSIIAFPGNVAAIVAEAQVERALKLSGPADIRLTSVLQLTSEESCGDIASALIKPSLRLHPFTELVSGGGLYLPPAGVSAFIVNPATDLLMTYSKRFAAAHAPAASARSIAMLRRAATLAAGRAAAEQESRGDAVKRSRSTASSAKGGLAGAILGEGSLAPALDDLSEGLAELSGLTTEANQDASKSAGALVAENSAAVATATLLGGGSGNTVLEMRAGVGVTSYKTLIRRYLRSVLGKVRKLPAKAKMTDATVREGPLPGRAEAKEPDLPEDDGEADAAKLRESKVADSGVGGPVVPVLKMPRGINYKGAQDGNGSSDDEDDDDECTDEEDEGMPDGLSSLSSLSITTQRSGRQRAGSGTGAAYLEPLDDDEAAIYGPATDLASFGLQPVEGGIFGHSMIDSPSHQTASYSSAAADGASPTYASSGSANSGALSTAGGMRSRVGSSVGDGAAAPADAAPPNPHHPASGALREGLERDEFSQRRASSHLWTQEVGDAAVTILMQGLASLIACLPAKATHVDSIIRRPTLAQLMPTSAIAADADPEVIDIEAQAESQAAAMRRIGPDDDDADDEDDAEDEDAAAGGEEGRKAKGAEEKKDDGDGVGAGKKKGNAAARKLLESLSWTTETLTGVNSGRNALGSRGPGYANSNARAGSGGSAGLLKKLMLKGVGKAGTTAVGLEAVNKDGEGKDGDAGDNGESGDEAGDGPAGAPPPTAGSASSSSSSSLGIPRSSRLGGKDGKGRGGRDGVFRGMTALDYGQCYWEPGAYLAETKKVRAFVLVLRGINRQSLHAHHEANRDFELALKFEPSRGDTHLHQAVSLLALGRPDAAAASCLEALRLGCDPAVANDRLGQARRQQGQHDKAVEAFTAALEAHPDYPPYLSRRAAALKTLGKLEASLEDLNRALATMGGLEPRLLRQRGEVYARQNRFESAIQDYLSALQALSLQAGGVSTGGLSGPAGSRGMQVSSPVAAGKSAGGARGAVSDSSTALVPAQGSRRFSALAYFRHASDVHFHAGVCAANLDKHERALQHFNAALACLSKVQSGRRLLRLAYRYQERLRGPQAFVLLNAPAPAVARLVESQSPKGTSNPFKRPTALASPAPGPGTSGGGRAPSATAGASSARASGTMTSPSTGQGRASMVGGTAPAAGAAATAAAGTSASGRRSSLSGPEAAIAAAAASAARGGPLSDDQMKSLYHNATALPNASAAGVAQAITNAVFSQSTVARKKQQAREAEAAAAASGTKDPRSLRYGMGGGAGNAAASPLHSNVAFVTERRRLLKVLARNAEELNRRAPDAFLPLLRAALHHERAKTLQMLGRHEEAYVDFTLVLAHCPTHANATFRRAFSARAMRHFVASGDDFETAAALAPEDDRFQINYNGLNDVATVVLVAAGEEPHCDVAGALAAVNTVARGRMGALSGHGVGFEPIDGIADDEGAE